MKVIKVSRNIAIVLTVLAIILNIVLCINLSSTMKSLSDVDSLITMLFEFGNLVFGLTLVPIIWIQFFLIWAGIKVYNKFSGFNKWLLLSLIIASGIFLVYREIITLRFIFTILLLDW